MTFSAIDPSESPPRVAIPRAYNAAVDLLDRHVVEGRGDRVAVIDDRGSWTYRALADRASQVGHALRSLGVRQEQRVAMCMLDTIDFPSVFLGSMKIGAVPVPLNHLLTVEDYAFLLDDSRARVLVVSDALY
jgi:acyl-coenzyme A synthetase/AMP-(fatty) acid ligase